MKTAATILLLLLFVPVVNSQAVQPNTQKGEIFKNFYAALDQLPPRFGLHGASQLPGDPNELLDKIRNNVKFLEAAMKAEQPVPKEYLDSLALDAKLLMKLVGSTSDSVFERRKLYNGLEEVESDLELKVYSRRGAEIFRVVEVLVRAMKGDRELGGYEVAYVPKGWADTPSQFKRFDRPTNPHRPTTMKLSPGNYLLWLRKGELATERQPVSLGAGNEASREIELLVP